MDSTGLPLHSDVISAEYLEHFGLLPLGLAEGKLRVGTWRPEPDPQALDDLRLLFGAEPELVLGPEAELREAIRRAYAPPGETAEALIAELHGGAGGPEDRELPLDDLRALANEAPVIRLVNLLLLEALESRASDIHLEAQAAGLRVRYRIDGVLLPAPSPPGHLRNAIVSRLKIMAELDIAERRAPQDGRIRLRLQDREVDVRISVVPVLHGESVVLRLLDKQRGTIALGDLGMAADTLARFSEAITRPHGIVLVTGPTGSGKTTTLYAAVERLASGTEKILTVEDPIEYELPGVCQVPVNGKAGVTFASALRALLRQDPDVLLVGEIRDGETAAVVAQAALTGHLVLATLHTNDAPGALTRLMDLGVPEYLVASTVQAVLAQRLIRKVCERCAVSAGSGAAAEAALIGLSGLDLSRARVGRGCAECRGTGLRGRTGIYELLPVTDELRREIARRRGARELREAALAGGMRGVREDGAAKVREGITTPAEVLRVTSS